jgi:hypothetical protein
LEGQKPIPVSRIYELEGPNHNSKATSLNARRAKPFLGKLAASLVALPNVFAPARPTAGWTRYKNFIATNHIFGLSLKSRQIVVAQQQWQDRTIIANPTVLLGISLPDCLASSPA